MFAARRGILLVCAILMTSFEQVMRNVPIQEAELPPFTAKVLASASAPNILGLEKVLKRAAAQSKFAKI